jgi:nucleoside 2-deoxyribosyltransferase
MKINKTTVYLAGACQHDRANWREPVIKELSQYDVEILNPWEFEPEQLKGLQPNRLPEEMITRSGQTMKNIPHWHIMGEAKVDTPPYKRFMKYGRRIVHYDTDLVPKCDYIIADWSKETQAGGGTHAEVTFAFKAHKPVYTLRHKDQPIPYWVQWCSSKIFDSQEELFEFLKEELGS